MDNNGASNVSIVDIKMPFMSMVVFMVKASLAAIPAAIIVVVIVAMTMGVIGSLGNP